MVVRRHQCIPLALTLFAFNTRTSAYSTTPSCLLSANERNHRPLPLRSISVGRSMTPSFSTVNPSTPTLQPGDALFGRFIISVNCIFYRSALNSLAFVNLRPIVPGHVLVIPQRVVAELNDLEAAEYTDLWTTVRRVQLILRNLHADKQLAFNVAVQDGVAAGQTVPHVHVHILPRVAGDYKRNDDIYRDLEAWAPRDDLEHVASQLSLIVPEDDQRRDRTANEMAEEAATYRKIAETLEHA